MQRVVARLPWRSEARKGAPRGVYLWGGVGRGKTLLMDYFFAALEFADRAPGAMRAHFYHFMREVHAELRSITDRATPLDVVAQRLAARARVICLDEFFVADIGDAMILAGLLAGLMQRGVTLVTTSNRAPQELYKDGLQRQRFLPAIELLQSHFDVIHLDGGVDYRLRQLEQAPTYLDSTRPGTTTALQERFATMTGGTAAGPQTLTIEGRALRARAAAPGMAYFDFVDLCEGPRSQNDYIELARLYHTLFLADIPRFDQFNENAARRFIMLIDELYDRGVKLVVSAAAAPAALYGGDRLRFEFERAASRLIEMQTQHYLAGQHRP
jgi:cell division protein ZapE